MEGLAGPQWSPENPEFSCSHRRLRSVSMKTPSAAGLLLLAVVLAGCQTDGYAAHPRRASSMIAQVGNSEMVETGETRRDPPPGAENSQDSPPGGGESKSPHQPPSPRLGAVGRGSARRSPSRAAAWV